MHPQFLVWCLTFGAHFKNDGHYFCGAGGNRPDGSDEALTAIQSASQKWTMPLQDWRIAMSRFIIDFGDRLDGHF
ncbi:hypothetical protein HJC50_004574 [Escherichia coli]|nr:hypothetical protein [Escherichia coli]